MSLHKLKAGSGYDYLTRQVAALDSTEKGRAGLASYYSERGERPGVWVGSGMAGIDGLDIGDPVTADQMRALFGCGLHPLAELRQQELAGPNLTNGGSPNVARLGVPFKALDGTTPFQVEVAKRIAALNAAIGVPADAAVAAADRARVRSQVGRESFFAEHGRKPVDVRELAGQIAKESRPRAQAVAGYDLTFSPVKSVSALWAVADPSMAAAIERAHQAAVSDALTFIERHALFTRTGSGGIRQVDVRGLVAAAFTHRDSRAGDPDLHTHVAVANKVQTMDGRWLSIDGRVLFKANVAASETYNTALESHLRDALGVQFEERAGADPGKRAVREIVGVDPALNARWSTRRKHIDVRRGELAVKFQAEHGRPPTPVEALQLAQQATLETRDAKHEPRSLTEQRTTWRREAVHTLGGEHRLEAMLHRALHPATVAGPTVDSKWLDTAADVVLAELESRRSTWQVWHVRAEAQRQLRAADLPAGLGERVVDLLIGAVLDRSIKLTAPDDGIVEPDVLRRRDGSSVYTVAGSVLHTSQRILDAEQRLVTAAGRHDGAVADHGAVELALLELAANRTPLDAGQAALVRSMCTSGARLQLALAPAGAGKTTAMRALALAWTEGGGTMVGLAPSAAAAAVLEQETGIRSETLAKLTWHLRHGDLPDWAQNIGRSSLVVMDEAGMADTMSLDTVVSFVLSKGGCVRLVGDDQQLAAIGAGGVLRDIHTQHGALRLTELHRFTDPAEAAATLALRDGQPDALNFYLNHGRVHVGDLATATQDAFHAWAADRANGLDAVMLAPTRDLVADLNRRARTHRLHGDTAQGPSVVLADGNPASVGDTIITRTNDRRLRLTPTDWVKNGDRWTITQVSRHDGLTVRHNSSHLATRLPADYVRASVGLGYATTIHAAQGVTADTMHGLATGQESRQQLYTMLARGRTANHLYLQVVGDGNPHSVIHPDTVTPRTPTEILQQIMSRDDTPTSATTQLRDLQDPAGRLYDAVHRYTDSLQTAVEQTLPASIIDNLDSYAGRLVPGLTDEPGWPTLRANLLHMTVTTGEHPLTQLQIIASPPLPTATDTATALNRRLEDTPYDTTGPLPWLPGIPPRLQDHPAWGSYLDQRAQLVTDLARQVHAEARPDPNQPSWVPPGGRTLSPATLGDVAVWRAATGVLGPIGDSQLPDPIARGQRQFGRQIPLQTRDANPPAGRDTFRPPRRPRPEDERYGATPTPQHGPAR